MDEYGVTLVNFGWAMARATCNDPIRRLELVRPGRQYGDSYLPPLSFTIEGKDTLIKFRDILNDLLEDEEE